MNPFCRKFLLLILWYSVYSLYICYIDTICLTVLAKFAFNSLALSSFLLSLTLSNPISHLSPPLSLYLSIYLSVSVTTSLFLLLFSSPFPIQCISSISISSDMNIIKKSFNQHTDIYFRNPVEVLGVAGRNRMSFFIRCWIFIGFNHSLGPRHNIVAGGSRSHAKYLHCRYLICITIMLTPAPMAEVRSYACRHLWALIKRWCTNWFRRMFS